MADPFLITGPAVISFSGGRTSAYMLWRILQAHGGQLPGDVVVCFANTGREMPATLDFVHECATRWGVHVTWLEYRRDAETGRTWTEVVNHNSASQVCTFVDDGIQKEPTVRILAQQPLPEGSFNAKSFFRGIAVAPTP